MAVLIALPDGIDCLVSPVWGAGDGKTKYGALRNGQVFEIKTRHACHLLGKTLPVHPFGVL